MGPAYARTLLEELDLELEDIDRICYLVGHHHTYTNMDGMDYQILVEADFLVNLYEDELGPEAVGLPDRIGKDALPHHICCGGMMVLPGKGAGR